MLGWFKRSAENGDCPPGQKRGPQGKSRVAGESAFHILTPTVDRGDAVSNDVFGMRDALRESGFQAHVYCEHISSAFAGEVSSVSDFAREVRKQDVLILHHSLAWDQGERIYQGAPCRRVMKYHNITPARFFVPYNQSLSDLCVRGREQLSRLVAVPAALYLGDSGFNAQELLELGADPARCHALAPFHHAEALEKSRPDISVLQTLLDGMTNLLFVGRFAPNKGHLHLLRTLAYFRQYINPRCRLVLVGKPDSRLDAYNHEIHCAISDLGLAGAVYTVAGAASAQLHSIYLSAHVFLCLSEHEGFCVPLVEAMLHKTPIVALAAAAVPETLGPEALVLDSLEEDVIAESVAYCLEDSSLRRYLAERAHERYAERFSSAVLSREFIQLMRNLID